MSNAGYGNYVEETPGKPSSDKAPPKPGDTDSPATGSTAASGQHDGSKTPGEGSLPADSQGDEVDPGVG